MAAAARIHTQIQSGQYSMIYRESAPAFQTSGNESQFISQMMNINAENGSFKDAVLIAYQMGVDSQVGRTHSLVFSVHYEQGKMREHLLFTRSSNSQMQLLKISMEPID